MPRIPLCALFLACVAIAVSAEDDNAITLACRNGDATLVHAALAEHPDLVNVPTPPVRSRLSRSVLLVSPTGHVDTMTIVVYADGSHTVDGVCSHGLRRRRESVAVRWCTS